MGQFNVGCKTYIPVLANICISIPSTVQTGTPIAKSSKDDLGANIQRNDVEDITTSSFGDTCTFVIYVKMVDSTMYILPFSSS